MKIGSQAGKLTAISASNPEAIVVRGHDLCADLIGRISFTDHAWLLVTGELPSPEQRRVLAGVPRAPQVVHARPELDRQAVEERQVAVGRSHHGRPAVVQERLLEVRGRAAVYHHREKQAAAGRHDPL